MFAPAARVYEFNILSGEVESEWAAYREWNKTKWSEKHPVALFDLVAQCVVTLYAGRVVFCVVNKRE